MAYSFVEAFVDKLILLEKNTGTHVHYRLMEPQTVAYHDIIGIQNLASRIAEFVGLTQCRFIVGIAKQKENVGGQIDLSDFGGRCLY